MNSSKYFHRILIPAVASLAGAWAVALATAVNVQPPAAQAAATEVLLASRGAEALSPAAASPPALTECPSATVRVDSAKELDDALDDAEPGDVIALADGVYSDEFRTREDGTAHEPIYLCGSSKAILDGDGTSGGYVLHLDGADHWRLIGFTVRDGQKGIMLDESDYVLLQELTVYRIGDEAIHLRENSSYNRVTDSEVYDTGNRKPQFGEGIYVGSAQSNWKSITRGKPDRSDYNVIEDNDIHDVTGEAVDIKEGTSGGILRGNSFDGSDIAQAGADSWVDVKGNDWLIEGNEGTNSPMDGFQTHEILAGWGTGNVFRDNLADVDGPGFGFSFTPELGNVLTCSNDVMAAGEGFANVSCVPEDGSRDEVCEPSALAAWPG